MYNENFGNKNLTKNKISNFKNIISTKIKIFKIKKSQKNDNYINDNFDKKITLTKVIILRKKKIIFTKK